MKKVIPQTKHTGTSHILLSMMLVLCFHSFSTISGQVSVLGTVLDENKRPYIGANITVHGISGTVTNSEGEFVLNDINARDICIEISAIGYKNVVLCGQTDTLHKGLLISLVPEVQELEEVKVNGNVEKGLKRTESVSVQLVKEQYLNQAKASSLMQTLNAIPGINSMDIGTGISKPMIRGMGYYRVVVAQNGIKQEGQQWSNHHGVSIDQQSVGHIEIIKGPASLQYGSDAIGGVINIFPEPVPLTSGISGEVSFTAKSNTKWLGGSAEFSFRKGDVYSNIVFTYNSYGDFLIPETDSFLLPAPTTVLEATHKVRMGNQVYNTAGDERAFSISTGIVKPWGNSYVVFNYYGTKTGFFNWQEMQNDSIRLMHGENSRDILLPYQQVNNYAVQHFTNRYYNDDKFEIGIGYQFNDSKEYDYLDDRYGIRNTELIEYRNKGNLDLGLLLQTFSGNIFYTLKRLNGHSFKFGLSTQFQVQQTDGYSHILPDYNRFSNGFFVTYKYNLSDKWLMSSGVRLDYTHFNMDESLNPNLKAEEAQFDSELDYGDSILNAAYEKTYPGTAFSLGFNYTPGRNTIFKFNVGKSFRVPSAYELGAYGLHRHGGRFEKGNTENDPEQAWQLDLGIEQKWKDFKISFSPFLYYFTNYLYLNPSAELRPEGQVYEYRQTSAMLLGTEASIRYLFYNKMNFSIDGEYVYAVNLDLNSALPFTPPLNLRSEVSYVFKDQNHASKSKIGLELLTVAAQNYTVPNELNTPGYNSLNLFAISEITLGNQQFNLMLKVRNLLNSSYYNHLSFYRRMRIPEQGRDVQLYISIPIN